MTERGIRAWAYRNAFQIIVVAVMFPITWVILVVGLWL